MKTIILGLGNPLFADDGVGLAVAHELGSRLAGSDVTVAQATVAGLDVLEILQGFERAVVIDAVQTGDARPGTIYHLKETQAPAGAGSRPHQFDCLAALKLGRSLGMSLPADVTIVGVEAATLTGPSEVLSEEVRAAIPLCVEMIQRELEMGTAA